MPDHSHELLHGTLDALILKTLAWGPRHGYAIAAWLEQTTDDTLRIGDGSLYPALYRLEKKGLIEAEWGTGDLGRRAKFYALTRAGRARLKTEVRQWSEFSAAVSKVLLLSTND
jgi:transcriptional regulator